MAEPSPFEQSLPLCCALAVVGGVLEVFATAVTASPKVKEAQGQDKKPLLYYLALGGNVSLQLTGSILSHLVATWFGPVSIVVPFFYAATLLSNMAVFGSMCLGLEHFSKIMKTGNFIIVVAVVLMPVVGPDIQEDQDINELLRHFYSAAWFMILLVAMTITGMMVGFTDITKHPMPTRIAILLVARASAICINLTVSRGFICHPSHPLFVFLTVLKIVSGAVYTYAIVVQSSAVNQARFVPLNTCTIIVTNAATGIIIWEDFKVIISWYGYICIFVMLGLGCDLLLSARVSLLTEDHPPTSAAPKHSKRGGSGPRQDQKIMHTGNQQVRMAMQFADAGMMLQKIGDYNCALEQFEQCLNIQKDVLGWDHPETASSYMNIGCLLATMGDYDGASTELQKCFAIRRMVFGMDHPFTYDCLEAIEAVMELSLTERTQQQRRGYGSYNRVETSHNSGWRHAPGWQHTPGWQ